MQPPPPPLHIHLEIPGSATALFSYAIEDIGDNCGVCVEYRDRTLANVNVTVPCSASLVATICVMV